MNGPLDKTAEAFRQLHVERSSAMEKWQEALALISLRETELQESFEKVSKIKTNVFNLEIELKEQNNFLDNEKDNVRELQHHIDCEENDYRYSCSKIRKVQNEHLNIVCQNLVTNVNKIIDFFGAIPPGF